MEHLIENISWLQENDYLRGFVFGLVHTIIPLIGFYSGWSVNRLLKIASNGYIAGIFGIVISTCCSRLYCCKFRSSFKICSYWYRLRWINTTNFSSNF
jgi:H+/Cl- antiporter ClcA